jgi:NTE family protein
MTGATNEKSAKRIEIGLVLQGGGALGAYEWGGILALFDLMDEAEKAGKNVTLRVVTGVSIGAINAACIVGAKDRSDARARLAALWNDFMIDRWSLVPSALSSSVALCWVPNFYRFSPGFTHLYETRELLTTLSNRVDFDALNTSDTAFVVTAVDVERGTLTWFANQQVGVIAPTKIGPQHVLASGSLAPQFPWTDVNFDGQVRHYWDGGLVDNTPLGAVIDVLDPNPDVYKLLVVMNLFPVESDLPRNLTEVNERVDQLRFGNRLLQDVSTATQFNNLIKVIGRLAALVPELPSDLRETVDHYKFVEPIEISLGTGDSSDDSLKDPYGFRDFSQQGIEQRCARGYETTRQTLDHVIAAAA